MTDSRQYEFETERKAISEAMVLASVQLQKTKTVAWWSMLVTGITILLMSLGGIAAVWFASMVLGFGFDPGKLVFVIGAILGLFWFQRWYGFAVQSMAGLVQRTRFMQGPQKMEFDAKGVTYSNATSQWHTDWAGVQDVVRGKHCVAVVISGVALALPLSQVSDDSDLMAQIERWRA